MINQVNYCAINIIIKRLGMGWGGVGMRIMQSSKRERLILDLIKLIEGARVN